MFNYKRIKLTYEEDDVMNSLFLTMSMFFQMCLEGLGPRKWRKRDWGEISSSKILTISRYSLTFSKRA